MGARNQGCIGFSYRPASLCSLATQFQTRFLESLPRPSFCLRSFSSSLFPSCHKGWDSKLFSVLDARWRCFSQDRGDRGGAAGGGTTHQAQQQHDGPGHAVPRRQRPYRHHLELGKRYENVNSRGLQGHVVHLSWPVAPSYMSPNAGGWLRGLSQWEQLCTSRDIGLKWTLEI